MDKREQDEKETKQRGGFIGFMKKRNKQICLTTVAVYIFAMLVQAIFGLNSPFYSLAEVLITLSVVIFFVEIIYAIIKGICYVMKDKPSDRDNNAGHQMSARDRFLNNMKKK